jgi:hypothetical protein
MGNDFGAKKKVRSGAADWTESIWTFLQSRLHKRPFPVFLPHEMMILGRTDEIHSVFGVLTCSNMRWMYRVRMYTDYRLCQSKVQSYDVQVQETHAHAQQLTDGF